jgi:hypothetical protein
MSPRDVGFTCTNRDGSKGGGCTFCNNASFSPNGRRPTPLAEQMGAVAGAADLHPPARGPLPGQTPTHSLTSQEQDLGISADGLEVHPLHLVKATRLANEWRRGDCQPPSFYEFTAEATRRSVRVGNIAEVETLTGQGDRVVEVHNDPFTVVPDVALVVTPSSRYRYVDYGLSVDVGDPNGHYPPFAYQAESIWLSRLLGAELTPGVGMRS